jgi:flagellar motor switch protein FliN
MDPSTTEQETLEALLRKVQSGGMQAVSPNPAFSEVSAMEETGDSESRRPPSDLLKGVHLKVRVELGRTKLPLKAALQLQPGAVLDLDKLANDPVELYVNEILIARGEVVVINDCFCVRITEITASHGATEEER